MLKTFKEIKKEIDARRKDREWRYDSDGRAVVELSVRDDSTFTELKRLINLAVIMAAVGVIALADCPVDYMPLSEIGAVISPN